MADVVPSRTHYLTLAEAASHLNVSEKFVRTAVSARRVRFYKLGKLLRFDVADLDTLARPVEVSDGFSELADRAWLSARRLG